MRRKDREVTGIQELIGIIDQCKICRIAMVDGAGPYIVPMNFGYAYDGNQLVLYFHCAKEGRKIDAMKQNPMVCFEMDCEHRLIEGDNACSFAYSFKSVIGSGRAELVDDSEEKKTALSLLMKHQTGREFSFDDKMAASVTVFKIIAQEFAGKYHP
jgi:nitroimidazol reductase NimA-like FMN-containing flavoprotein (pyridoxamine 5'-phosphate oxidase superfamily)